LLTTIILLMTRYSKKISTIKTNLNRYSFKRWRETSFWWELVRKRLFVDNVVDFGNISNAIFILGSGRSGTTWISNLVNFRNKYHYIFEPFHPIRNQYLADIPIRFKERLYIPSETKNKKYEDYFRSVLSGHFHRTPWTNRYNRVFITNRRIVKSIRGHLFIQWLLECFPQIKIIYILRHPLGTILSQINNERWNNELIDTFLEQKEFADSYLINYQDMLLELRDNGSQFEKLIVCWCIENATALKQLEGKDFELVFYEDTILNPIDVYNNLQIFRNKQITSNKDIKKFEMIIGQTYLGPNILKDKMEQIEKWQKEFSEDEIIFLEKMLKLFSLDRYYSAKSPLPIYKPKQQDRK
jgi:hypothetical protein